MKTNPYNTGDLVTLPHRGNGTAEGVLWQVIKSDKNFIWIKPIYTVTGRSVLRQKRVRFDAVNEFGIVDLGLALQELQSLTISYFRLRSGITDKND